MSLVIDERVEELLAEVERLRATNAELLTALRRIVDCIDHGEPSTLDAYDDAYDIARAAIAKAEEGK